MTTGISGYCLKASLPGHNSGGALRAHASSHESWEKHRGNQPIELSVVVAAQDFGSSLRKCLTGLTAQLAPARAEILVVSGPGGEVVFQLGKKFPSIQFIQTPVASSIPRLWSAGIAAARGRIVALTIEQCVPAPDWAEQTLRGHAAEWPAIGGAIDIEPGLGLVDWAVYFCRYSRYTPPFPPEFLDDLPGDNCTYKRAALESLREVIADGFWETFVHQAMRRKGERLLSDPSILVYYAGSFSWGTFFARRFRQGRYFAARRAREMGTGPRLVRAQAGLSSRSNILAGCCQSLELPRPRTTQWSGPPNAFPPTRHCKHGLSGRRPCYGPEDLPSSNTRKSPWSY